MAPDSLSDEFIFNLKFFLSPTFFLLRCSLDEGVFLDMWKLCFVSPIFKSGDASRDKNYRLISILSHIGILFESLVLKNIQPSVKPTIMDEQNGFQFVRFTLAYIVFFSNYIFSAFNADSEVDIIFLDLKKAFDHANH